MRASGDVVDDSAAFRAHALQIEGSWSVHDDDDGHLFYFNLESGESRWQVPEELRALESEFMMKLMLDGALARSGVWTVHDAGDGTLYYFNEDTRESMWDRPEKWGVVPVVQGNGQDSIPPPPPPPPPPPGMAKKPQFLVKADDTKKVPKTKKKKSRVQDEDKPVPAPAPTGEELEAQRKRDESAQLSRENFKELLRDKKIMPFCKWSVAFPLIAVDPRFLAVPTMDERREIFEDFVKNRRGDLKSEKKLKLRDAKRKFSKAVREQFKAQRERGDFDEKLTLSVFLATLEDNIAVDQLQSFQQEVLAFLPMAVQEKLWTKEMSEYLEATKAEREIEARLFTFLRKRLSDRVQYVGWHDAVVQDAIAAFGRTESNATSLPEFIQQAVVYRVAKKLSMSVSEPRARPFVADTRQNRLAADQHLAKQLLNRHVDLPLTEQMSEAARSRLKERDNRRSHSHTRERCREGSVHDQQRSRRSSSRSSSSGFRSRSRSQSQSRSRGRGYKRELHRSYDRETSRRRGNHHSRRSRSSSSRSRSSPRGCSRDRSQQRR